MYTDNWFTFGSVVHPSQEAEEVISLVSRSPRNKISEVYRLESTTDLLPALDRLHELIQLMQGNILPEKLVLLAAVPPEKVSLRGTVQMTH